MTILGCARAPPTTVPHAFKTMSFLISLYQKWSNWLASVSPHSLQLTGILGLALAIIGWYQLRGNRNAPRPSTRPTATGVNPSARPTAQSTAAVENKAVAAKKPDLSTAHGRAIASRLVGVRKITISLPGVVLQEQEARQLQDSATVMPETVSIVQEICKAADTYMLVQVPDDVGEAAVTGAMEAAGLLGRAPHQLPPHRLLFCSTLEGKASIVRQIEPELHIDGQAATIQDLVRFIPQLVHVCAPGVQPVALEAQHVGHAPSLATYFS